jgi:hypothetical protein
MGFERWAIVLLKLELNVGQSNSACKLPVICKHPGVERWPCGIKGAKINLGAIKGMRFYVIGKADQHPTDSLKVKQ